MNPNEFNPLDIDVNFFKSLLSDQYVFLTRVINHAEEMCRRMGQPVEMTVVNEFTRFCSIRAKTVGGSVIIRHEPGGFFMQDGNRMGKLGLKIMTAIVAASIKVDKYAKKDFLQPAINKNSSVTHATIVTSHSYWQRAIQSGVPTELKVGVKVDGNAMDRATLKLSALKLTKLMFLKSSLEKDRKVPEVPDDANELQVARAIVGSFIRDRAGFLQFVSKYNLIKLELDFERWQQQEMLNFKKRLE